jgi:hypothetical protein
VSCDVESRERMQMIENVPEPLLVVRKGCQVASWTIITVVVVAFVEEFATAVSWTEFAKRRQEREEIAPTQCV